MRLTSLDMSERFAALIPVLLTEPIDEGQVGALLEEAAERAGAVRVSEWRLAKTQREGELDMRYYLCEADRS